MHCTQTEPECRAACAMQQIAPFQGEKSSPGIWLTFPSFSQAQPTGNLLCAGIFLSAQTAP